MRSAPAAGVALVVLLSGGSAAGYRRTHNVQGLPLRWQRSCVTVTVFAGDPPSPLDRATLEAGARAAAAAWSTATVACTGLALTVELASGARGDAAFDHRNSVTFRRVVWHKEPCDPATAPAGCALYDPAAVAVTTVFALPDTGEIVDADIELNAVDNRWGDLVRDGLAAGAHADVQNVITHELGHLIGLDHSPVVDATMFARGAPGETSKRHLAEDDVAGVCDVYPAEEDLACPEIDPRPPVAAGGCALGGAARGPSVIEALLLALVALAQAARKR